MLFIKIIISSFNENKMNTIKNNIEGLNRNLIYVQNELSNILGFSLRIMHKDALSNTLEYLADLNKNVRRELFLKQKKDQILSFNNELVKKSEGSKYSKPLPYATPVEQNLIWKTNVSFSNFFLRNIKADPILNAHSQITYLQKGNEAVQNPGKIFYKDCSMGTQMKEFVFTIENFKNNILFGGQFFVEEVQKKDSAEECINNLLNYSEYYSNNDQRNMLTSQDAWRLKELINKITVIDKESYYEHGAKRAKLLLNMLFEIAKNNDFIFSKDNWRSITRALAWLYSKQQEEIALKLMKYFKIKDKNYFSIIFNILKNSQLKIKIPLQRDFFSDKNNINKCIPVIKKALLENDNLKLVDIELEKSDEEVKDIVSDLLSRKFYNFLNKNDEYRKKKYFEDLLSISEEMSISSGELQYQRKEQNQSISENPVNKIVDIFLRKATRLVIGDVAVFAFVNYVSGKLEYFKNYISDKKFSWKYQYEKEIDSLSLFSDLNDNNILIKAINNKKALLIDNLDNDKYVDIFGKKDIKSCLVVPIFFHEIAIGVININGVHTGQFDEEMKGLIEGFAKTIAPYIHQARLMKSIDSIHEIALDNIKFKTEKAKLDEMSKKLCDLFFASAASIWFPKVNSDYKWFTMAGSYGIGNKNHIKTELPTKESLIGEAIKSDNVFAVSDITDEKDSNVKNILNKNLLIDSDIKSLMICPNFIEYPDSVTEVGKKLPVSTIHIYRRKDIQFYSNETIRIFSMIGKLVGTAISSFKIIHGEIRERENLRLFAAHEIRSPINSMKTIAGLIQKGPSQFSSVKWKYLLEDFDIRADLAVTRLNHLVRMVKSPVSMVSFFEKDDPVLKDARQTVKMDVERVRVNDIINNIRYTRKSIQKEIKLYNAELRPCIFSGSKRILNHIFENVIENAIKYSAEHSIIDIVYKESENNYYWSIKNIGIGIVEGEESYIFQKSKRGTNIKNVQGEGIGLYYAKEYAKMYDGCIELIKNEAINEDTNNKLSRILYETIFQIYLKK